jgi:hypothetical protein
VDSGDFLSALRVVLLCNEQEEIGIIPRMKATIIILLLASCSLAQKSSPPLQVTVIGSDIVGLPNGSYVVMGQVRFSDGMIAAMRKHGATDADKMRFTIMCGKSHPGCQQLEDGENYWMQYVHPGEEGYSEYLGTDADCHPARFGRTIGKKAAAVYNVCFVEPKRNEGD